MSKAPWYKTNAAEELSDEGLALCSIAAQGLWHRLNLIMWTSDRRGFLVVRGKRWSREDAAKVARTDRETANGLMAELLVKGIAAVDSDGAIYSPTLVRQANELADDANMKRVRRLSAPCPPRVRRLSPGCPPQTTDGDLDRDKDTDTTQQQGRCARDEPPPTPVVVAVVPGGAEVGDRIDEARLVGTIGSRLADSGWFPLGTASMLARKFVAGGGRLLDFEYAHQQALGDGISNPGGFLATAMRESWRKPAERPPPPEHDTAAIVAAALAQNDRTRKAKARTA